MKLQSVSVFYLKRKTASTQFYVICIVLFASFKSGQNTAEFTCCIEGTFSYQSIIESLMEASHSLQFITVYFFCIVKEPKDYMFFHCLSTNWHQCFLLNSLSISDHVENVKKNKNRNQKKSHFHRFLSDRWLDITSTVLHFK